MNQSTRRFIRSMAGMAFWFTVGVIALSFAEYAFGQATSASVDKGVVLTPQFSVTWPILVFLLGAAAAWATMNKSITDHHSSDGIHLTIEDIAKAFPLSKECLLTHKNESERQQHGEDRIRNLETNFAALLSGISNTNARILTTLEDSARLLMENTQTVTDREAHKRTDLIEHDRQVREE